MSATRYKIFISSVQKELAAERRAVKEFITHDPLLRRFISYVFLFEDIPAKDRKPHGPIPRNPLIAEPLFRVKYVEKAGTGTTDMIADCRKAELPEPDFEQRGPHFVVILWRDWLTDAVMDQLGLTDNERKLVAMLKTGDRIANKSYQEKFGVTKPTASRHLEALTGKGVLRRIGTTGKGTYYVLSRKGLTKGSKGS